MAGVKFTEGAARRIVAATRAYERGSRDQPPVKFRTVSDEGPSFRLGMITEDWDKGETAEVTQLDADGNVMDDPVLFDAYNYFADITAGSGGSKVLCILLDGLWILVAAECE